MEANGELSMIHGSSWRAIYDSWTLMLRNMALSVTSHESYMNNG